MASSFGLVRGTGHGSSNGKSKLPYNRNGGTYINANEHIVLINLGMLNKACKEMSIFRAGMNSAIT